MDKKRAAVNVKTKKAAKGKAVRNTRTAAKRVQVAKKARNRRSNIRRPSVKRMDISSIAVRLPKKIIAAVAVLFVMLIVIIFAVKGCGVSHKTPERVVKTLIESYAEGKAGKAKKCFDKVQEEESLDQEIDATIKYFEAFDAEKITITQCDKIYQDGQNTCMYITYDIVLKDGQVYPGISTYMVQKNDEGKYYVMTSSEITDELSKQAAEKYADFMETQPYEEYVTAYDKFINKNPGYEETIAAKLN